MRWFTISALALALALAGSAAAESRRPTRPLDGGPILRLAPTLDDIYTNVLQPMCVQCHNSGTGLGWAADTKQTAWDTLVNQPSEFCDGTLVIPGNPGDSGLIQALEGTSPCISQMPLGDLPLPQETIDVVRNWITAGALFDALPVAVQASTWSGIKSLYR